MITFLRRCRGVLGIGVISAAAWAAVFAALVLIVGLVDPASIDPGEGPLRVAGIGAVFGFVSGVGFGVVLSLTERRKAISELSVSRAALWGLIGTAPFPLLTAVHDSVLLILGPIGAALAAASIAVAKKSPRLRRGLDPEE